jgi:methionyl-tRNA formyltransferase
MKIVFIGTVAFSLNMLKALLEHNAEVVGVVTASDSGINSDFTDLTPICNQYKVPVLLSDDVNSKETIEWISNP